MPYQPLTDAIYVEVMSHITIQIHYFVIILELDKAYDAGIIISIVRIVISYSFSLIFDVNGERLTPFQELDFFYHLGIRQYAILFEGLLDLSKQVLLILSCTLSLLGLVLNGRHKYFRVDSLEN